MLQTRFSAMMTQGRMAYLSLTSGKSADKAAEAALEAFRDEEQRQEFYRFFNELEDLYEILSPDSFLRPFIDDYQRLADLYALLRSAYEGKGLPHRELAHKTAHLVQEHTQAGLIREAVVVYEITPQTLDQLAQSQQPDTVKVFNLLKGIARKVEEGAIMAPYLLSIGERAEAIATAFKQRQLSTQEALKQLADLVREINEAEREQAERGISGAPFAVFWLLKQAGVSIAQAETVAAEMARVLADYPYRRTSDRQAREVRRALYRHLQKTGINNVPEVAERIMTVVQRVRA